MCICTRMGIHVHATPRLSHTSPTSNRQPINRQLSVPAYAQAHAPVHLHTRKARALTLEPLASHPSIAQCHGEQELSDQHAASARCRTVNAEHNVRVGAALECQPPAGGVVLRECLPGNVNSQRTHWQALRLATHAVAAHTRLLRGARALRGLAHPTTTRRALRGRISNWRKISNYGNSNTNIQVLKSLAAR
jgi:hypothetical protein